MDTLNQPIAMAALLGLDFAAADAVPSHSDSSVVQSFPGLFPHCDAIRLGHLSYVGNPERVVEEDARIDEDGVNTIEHA